MEVMEIIKDAFVFPSKDMKILLIYVILSVVAGLFSLGGTFAYILGFIVPEFLVLLNLELNSLMKFLSLNGGKILSQVSIILLSLLFTL